MLFFEGPIMEQAFRRVIATVGRHEKSLILQFMERVDAARH
jgi:hypothetical protein